MTELKNIFKKFTLVFILAAVFVACLTPSAQARRKKKLTPEEALQASVKREIEIGNKIAEEISKQIEFIEDPILTARVRGIFNRLTPWVSRPLPYNVHIVRQKSPNAFCVPGGNVYVTTGLIEFARSDSELAYVIAHELAHADGKHGIIQVERNNKLTLASLAVMIASRGAGAALVLSQAATLAISNAYSRDLEQEADIKAADIADSAGYDLVAGVTIMERLAQEELKMPWYDPTIPLDHPKLADRISYIAETVENKGYKINRKSTLRFLIPRLERVNDKLILKVDSQTIVETKYSPEMESYLEKAEEALGNYLQLETESFEIRVMTIPSEGKILSIGVKTIMSSPVPGGAFTLEAARKNILAALTLARKKHPLADYNR